MKKHFCLFFVLSFSSLIFSQISYIVPSSASIANTSVSNTHEWTAFQNPAMLGYGENSEIGLQYENRFLLSQISTSSFQALIATPVVNSDISLSYFGYSLYHEIIGAVGFGRNFSDKFSLGLRFNYYAAYFSASNSYRGILFPHLGFSYRFTPNFSIGCSAFNPFQMNIKTETAEKQIPSVFSIGSEYYFTPELIWLTQLDKEISSNYRIATGFEYQMLKAISVKIGAYTAGYLVPCLGMGLNFGNLKLDFNAELHPLLGLNSFVALRHSFRK